jgi:hypothetical protein
MAWAHADQDKYVLVREILRRWKHACFFFHVQDLLLYCEISLKFGTKVLHDSLQAAEDGSIISSFQQIFF